MLNPFIDLISNIIFLINLALMVWVVLALLLHFDIVNRTNPLVMRIYSTLGRVLEPLLAPIRKHITSKLPDMGGVDISPIVLILILHFIQSALYHWFYSIPLPRMGI